MGQREVLLEDLCVVGDSHCEVDHDEEKERRRQPFAGDES